MYKNNSIIFSGGGKTLSGSKYDIATDTKSFHLTTEDNSSIKVCMACRVFLSFLYRSSVV